MALKVENIKNRRLVYEMLPDGVTYLIYEYLNGKFHRTMRYDQQRLNLYKLQLVLTGD